MTPPHPGDHETPGTVEQIIDVTGRVLVIALTVAQAKRRYGSLHGLAAAILRALLRP